MSAHLGFLFHILFQLKLVCGVVFDLIPDKTDSSAEFISVLPPELKSKHGYV